MSRSKYRPQVEWDITQLLLHPLFALLDPRFPSVFAVHSVSVGVEGAVGWSID